MVAPGLEASSLRGAADRPGRERAGCLAGLCAFLARMALALTVPPIMASQVGQWLAPQLLPAAAALPPEWVGALGGALVGVIAGIWLLRQSLRADSLAERCADLALVLMSAALLGRTALGFVRPLALSDIAIAYGCVLVGAIGIAALGAAVPRAE